MKRPLLRRKAFLKVGIRTLLVMPLILSISHATISINGLRMNHLDIHSTDVPLLLPLGDSITLGGSASDCTGYKSFLHPLLNVAHKFVGFRFAAPSNCIGIQPDLNYGYSCGFPGMKSDLARDILPSCLKYLPLSNPQHQIVILHIGTNDITSEVPAQEISDNIIDIVDRIADYNSLIDIYVAQIIPRVDFSYLNDDTSALNAVIYDAVSAYKTTNQKENLHIIDLNSGYSTSWLNASAIHPTDTGYAWMAEQLAASINAH